MKVTIDLPEDLILDLKLKAVHERRKLKDVVAERLRATPTQSTPRRQPKSQEPAQSLPVLKATAKGKVAVAGLSAQQMSDWIKQQALDD